VSRRPSIRRTLSFALAWIVFASLATPIPASAEPLYAEASGIPTFSINGGGWGHSIGMSQYGTEGFATVAGWDYETILAHYFQGTTVRTLASLGHAANPDVRVNIDKDKASRSLWTFRGYGAQLRVIGSSTVDLTANVNHRFRASGGRSTWTRTPTACATRARRLWGRPWWCTPWRAVRHSWSSRRRRAPC
jgi:hypothetical protein